MGRAAPLKCVPLRVTQIRGALLLSLLSSRSAPGSTEHIPPTRPVCLSPRLASSLKGEAIQAQADSCLGVCSIGICIRWRFL